jgi:hypothetical protein
MTTRWSRLIAGAIASAWIVGAAAVPTTAQAPAAQTAERGTTTTWYFYKVKWGYQDEFVDLFKRNHYPILKAQRDAGRFRSVRTYVPRYHGDGRADWTFAVEIVANDDFKGGQSEEEIVRKLYPDQDTFRKEEQRRFEILEAHWDVPLNAIDLDAGAAAR